MTTNRNRNSKQTVENFTAALPEHAAAAQCVAGNEPLTIKGQIPLSYVGGNERVYEGVDALVKVMFSNGDATLTSVRIPPAAEEYIKSLGSTSEFWIERIQQEFDRDDTLLEGIIEDLDDAEYAAVELHASAYNESKYLRDGYYTELAAAANKLADFLKVVGNG